MFRIRLMTTSQISETTILTKAMTVTRSGLLGRRVLAALATGCDQAGVVVQAGGDLGGADPEDAQADREDDGLDEVAAALVGAGEAALPALKRGWSFWRIAISTRMPRIVPAPMKSTNRVQRKNSPMIGRWNAGFHTSPNASTRVRNRP